MRCMHYCIGNHATGSETDTHCNFHIACSVSRCIQAFSPRRTLPSHASAVTFGCDLVIIVETPGRYGLDLQTDVTKESYRLFFISYG